MEEGGGQKTWKSQSKWTEPNFQAHDGMVTAVPLNSQQL